MSAMNRGIGMTSLLSNMSKNSDSKSDSAPPSPVVGLRKSVSGTDMAGGHGPLQMPFDRKKAAVIGLRKWVRFAKNGDTTIMQADKHEITQQLGVQLRDLRLLDPQLHSSYPSALLCRDKALVVNLEHIKCIITKDEVLILNADDDSVVAFIEELQRRLAPGDDGAKAAAFLPASQSSPNLAAAAHQQQEMEADIGHFMREQGSPFELRALEVALDVVASTLERQTVDLEAAAHPALDELTAKVSTSSLERVRRIKNRLVRLTTRVQTLREMLEKLMDDDSDMHAMHLTARAQDQLERQRSLRASLDGALMRESILGGSPLSPKHIDDQAERDEEEIAEVEMILETYFMHVDNTFNKLQTLCEYIDDTEDYINIELDNHRNQLIRLELLLTALTLCVALVGVISGIFGMNLHNTHEDDYNAFILVSSVSSALAILIFIAIVLFCRWKKLL